MDEGEGLFWFNLCAEREEDVRVVILKRCCIGHAFEDLVEILGKNPTNQPVVIQGFPLEDHTPVTEDMLGRFLVGADLKDLKSEAIQLSDLKFTIPRNADGEILN